MLYWIYDVPALLVLVMSRAVFVGTCWLGIIFLCPRIKQRLHTDSGLNEILGDFLQFFGVIYGLLLGCSRSPPIRTMRMQRGRVQRSLGARGALPGCRGLSRALRYGLKGCSRIIRGM